MPTTGNAWSQAIATVTHVRATRLHLRVRAVRVSVCFSFLCCFDYHWNGWCWSSHCRCWLGFDCTTHCLVTWDQVAGAQCQRVGQWGRGAEDNHQFLVAPNMSAVNTEGLPSATVQPTAAARPVVDTLQSSSEAKNGHVWNCSAGITESQNLTAMDWARQ